MPNVELVSRLTDITAGWLLTYLIHSTVILLACWAIASIRHVSDTVREILWKSALVGGILTATAQTAVTREPLGGQLRLASRTRVAPASGMRLALRSDVPGAAPRFVFMRQRGTRWTTGLVTLWLTVAGGGLLWLTAGHARTLRALGRRMPLDGTPIGVRLRALVTRADVDLTVELTCSSAIASPVALPGNEVCLPRRALLELQPVEQDSMLAHEVAHLVRRDPQWLIAARAIEMVLFFQPLNRLARRRMQEVAEYLCDDWAIARTRQPVTLAKCLAAVAEWVGRAPRTPAPRLSPLSAMVESGGSPFVRRVGRILRGGAAPRARTSRIAVAGSTCALAALAGVVPRISVANPATMRGLTFVRSVTAPAGMMTRRDTVILFREGGARIAIDSLVRRRERAVAGALGDRADVVYERIRIDSALADSLLTGAVWTRRISPPGDSGFAGMRAMPLIDGEHAGLVVVERRGDR